jgi:hypothetical protein
MKTLFVFIVALLQKSIVTSASIVMRTLLFPLLSDLSRCNRFLVCHNMLLSRCQKAGQRHSIKIGNRPSEIVAKFKSLATTHTDQNCVHEDIKSRLNSGNACYRSVQSLLSFRLLSNNVKLKYTKPYFYQLFYMGVKLCLSR